MQQATPNQFVKYANFFFYSVGIKPYDKSDVTNNSNWLMKLIFFAGMGNLLLAVVFEIGFVVEAIRNNHNFVAATMTMSYIGFVSIGISKMAFIYSKRLEMTVYIRKLEEIFPYTLQQQTEYMLPKYLQLCTKISVGFSVLYMVDIWSFNLFDILNYIIGNRVLHISNAEQQLPYFMWIPWEYKDHWSFYVLYFAHSIAGYTSAAGQIASDLLLFSTASQVIMHYDYVSRCIENYALKNCQADSSEQDKDEDIAFLGSMITYHDKILGLSDLMNEVFGVPLLLNFFSSALVFCVLGFQMTIGIPRDQIIRLPIFLLTTLSQIFLISYFGQELIDASENIADAVYNQDWSNAEIRFKKMLILIAQRAQRPALLKATTFLDVSRATMTDVMQMSYKFFTLLRTMYSD